MSTGRSQNQCLMAGRGDAPVLGEGKGIIRVGAQASLQGIPDITTQRETYRGRGGNT